MNGISIAPPGARPNDPLLAAVMDWYLAAKQPSDHYGSHWDRFRPDFERLIATDALWTSYRRNGLTIGFDDNNFYAHGLRVGGMVRPEALPYSPQFAGDTVPEMEFNLADLARDAGTVAKHVSRLGPIERILELHDRLVAGDPPLVDVPSLGRSAELNGLELLWFALDMRSHRPEPPSVILEIGGGYGGLAAALHRIWPQARIVIIDLPEVLTVQIVHLRRLFPNADLRLVRPGPGTIETVNTPFTMIPAHAAERFAHPVDLAINLRSFMEMPQDIANAYLRQIQRLTNVGGTLYLANRLEKKPVWAGADAEQREAAGLFRLADMPFDAHWNTVADNPVPFQPHVARWIKRRTPA